MSVFVTGFGARDTHALVLNDGRANTHSSAGQAYSTVTLQDIILMAGQPPQVAKEHGQWIIPSSYSGHDARSHGAQLQHGQFMALAVDIDQGNPDLHQVLQAVDTCLGQQTWRLVWSTPSSTHQNKKWRALIPLVAAVTGAQYRGLQAALFDALEHLGIYPDRTMERTGQVLYLPNQGEYYQHAVNGTYLLDALSHPIYQRAQVHIELAAQVAANASNSARTEGARSFLAAFRRKHSVAELLALYGYQRKGNSDHWQSPYASGYSTQDLGDGWRSLSHSDAAANIGRPASTGNGCVGDQFDLYVHYQCQGNREQAQLYAKQCLQEEDRALLGAATAQHGALMWQSHLAWVKEQEALEAQQRAAEAQQAAAYAKEQEHALRRKWGGKWLDELPSNLQLEPSALEWAAWHAPGVIGEIVRAKAPDLKRHSLVPALMGAISAVAHICQGKFVSQWNNFITPSAMLIYLVGGTGSGKSDAMSTFYDVLNLVDKTAIRGRRIGHLGSGPAVIDFMAQNENPHCYILQNEGGAKRSVGRGDKHQEGVFAEITDLHTAFQDGVEGSHTKTSGSTGFINHPSLGGLFTSTPSKLFSAIDGADAESGWLGRNAFIPLRATAPNSDRRDAVYSADLAARLNRLATVLPPLPEAIHPDIWHGREGQSFHLTRYTPDTDAYLKEVLNEYDAISRDPRRQLKEQSIYSRALEMVNRLTFIAGLATSSPVAPACAHWAKLVVDNALEYVTQSMDTLGGDAKDDSDAGKVRYAIREIFTRVQEEEKLQNWFGKYTGYRQTPDGALLSLNKLRRKLLDIVRAPAHVVRSEINELIEAEALVEVPVIDAGRRKFVKWLD